MSRVKQLLTTLTSQHASDIDKLNAVKNISTFSDLERNELLIELSRNRVTLAIVEDYITEMKKTIDQVKFEK